VVARPSLLLLRLLLLLLYSCVDTVTMTTASYEVNVMSRLAFSAKRLACHLRASV